MAIVFRVFGACFDVDQVLGSGFAEKVERVWRVGERSRVGSARTMSGISMLLSESEDAAVGVAESVIALTEVLPHLSPFLGQGVTAEVDIALFVPQSKPQSVVLDSSILRAAEQYGFRIVVTAYPFDESDTEFGEE